MSPELQTSYRYKAHAFVDKADIRPIQAADLLAWQWYKSATRLAKGILKPRGDLITLLEGTLHKACPSASGGSISSGSIGELVIEQTSNISRNARPS